MRSSSQLSLDKNQERIISLFWFKSTARSKLYLTPFYGHGKGKKGGRHFARLREVLQRKLDLAAPPPGMAAFKLT